MLGRRMAAGSSRHRLGLGLISHGDRGMAVADPLCPPASTFYPSGDRTGERRDPGGCWPPRPTADGICLQEGGGHHADAGSRRAESLPLL